MGENVQVSHLRLIPPKSLGRLALLDQTSFRGGLGLDLDFLFPSSLYSYCILQHQSKCSLLLFSLGSLHFLHRPNCTVGMIIRDFIRTKKVVFIIISSRLYNPGGYIYIYCIYWAFNKYALNKMVPVCLVSVVCLLLSNARNL